MRKSHQAKVYERASMIEYILEYRCFGLDQKYTHEELMALPADRLSDIHADVMEAIYRDERWGRCY